MAAAISCMRGLPAGLARIQRVDTAPYTIAATAHTSAKISELDMNALPFFKNPDRETARVGAIPREREANGTRRRAAVAVLVPFPSAVPGLLEKSRSRQNPLLCQLARGTVEPIPGRAATPRTSRRACAAPRRCEAARTAADHRDKAAAPRPSRAA